MSQVSDDYVVQWKSEGEKELADAIKSLTEHLKTLGQTHEKTEEKTEEAAKQTRLLDKNVKDLANDIKSKLVPEGGKLHKNLEQGKSLLKASTIAFASVSAAATALIGAYGALTKAAVEYSKAGSEQQALDRSLYDSFVAQGLAADEAKKKYDELTGTIGTLTQGFGAIAGDEKLIKVMTNFNLATKSTVDNQTALNNILKISKVTGKDITKVQNEYIDAIKGGEGRLLKYAGLSKQQIENLNKITDETKRAEAVQKILTERFKDVDISGDDAASVLARFSNAVGGDLRQAIGGAINDSGAFQAALKPLSIAFENLQGWVKSNSATVKRWALDFAGALGTAIGFLSELGRSAADTYLDFKEFFVELDYLFVTGFRKFKEIVNDFVKLVSDDLAGLVEQLQTFARALGREGIAESLERTRIQLENAFQLDLGDAKKDLEEYNQSLKKIAESRKTVADVFDAVDKVSTGIASNVAAARVSDTTQRPEGSPVAPAKGGKAPRIGDPTAGVQKRVLDLEIQIATAKAAGNKEDEVRLTFALRNAQAQLAYAQATDKGIAKQQKIKAEIEAELELQDSMNTLMRERFIEQQKISILNVQERLLSTDLTEQERIRLDYERQRIELSTQVDLSPEERRLELLRLQNEEIKAQADLLQGDLLKAIQISNGAIDATGSIALAAADSFSASEKTKALISGAVETAKAVAATAEGITTGNPLALVGAAQHAVAAGLFFKAAGSGGGAKAATTGASAGSSGPSSGPSKSQLDADRREVSKENAQAIADAIAARTRENNEQQIVINLNQPTLLSDSPDIARQLTDTLRPEIQRVVQQRRR